MKIFVLFDKRGRHIEPAGDPESCPVETSLDRLASELRAGQERLRAAPLADLIGLCDAAGQAWTEAGSDEARMVGSLAIGFLPLQTAGLALGERRLEVAEALTARGVERCPEVGRMALYDAPWDGMFPMDRMVRWVSA